MSAPESVPIPDELRGEVEQAQWLGAAIYLQDKASAIGTDIALAHLRPADRQRIAGYLTVREADEPPADAWTVYFFTAADPPEIVFQVRVPMQRGARPTFEALDPALPAPVHAQQLIRARRTAIAAIGAPSQPQNPVVLPGTVVGHDGIVVYLVAGSARRDVAVFGKHHRVLVSPDGQRVARLEPLSKGIIEIPLHSPDAPAGTTLAGLAVTHLVTDCPLETHVFTSLLHRMPVAVSTARGTWQVDGAKISFLG